MRLAFTCNGPGETAGWLVPLLHAIYEHDPLSAVAVFYVPDDYASGFEPQYVRSLFPQAAVFDSKTYLKTAIGLRPAGVPKETDVVVYLGGDLMHAGKLQARLGGTLATYKFSRPRIAKRTARAFAVDPGNAKQLVASGVEPTRIIISGNLAIDGALRQAADAEALPEIDVLVMPGSRSYEVEHLVPFFFTAAVRMLRERPQLRIAFGISPFTDVDAVARALERGGDRRMYAEKAALARSGGEVFAQSIDGGVRIPIVREAIAAASRAKLALTIPGTKVIELAAVGTPVLSCTPMNAPELVAINGPLTYLNRIPLAGTPLKRAVVAGYARRFAYHTQPNMDANEALVRELHGTLTPGRVARAALAALDDTNWRERSSQALRSLYREHVGASARMAAGLLSL